MTNTSTKTIWILVVLLVLATCFWIWSVGYRARHAMFNRTGDRSMMMATGTPATDDQLQASVNNSAQFDSEADLTSIDTQF